MTVLHRRITVVGIAAASVAVSLIASAAPASAGANRLPKVPGGTSCCGGSFLTPGQSLYRPSTTNPVSNILRSVGLAADSRSSLAPTVLGAYLVLQGDGNLVEYAADSGQVLFTTNTTTAEKLAFQGDHNVVLYDAAGKVLWTSNTAGSAAAYFGPYGNGQLVTQTADGQFVSAVGTPMTSAPGVVVSSASSTNGGYTLKVQTDGNLVEYDTSTGQAVWSSHTAGKGPVRLTAQLDGNLVLYSRRSGKAVWSTGTAQKGVIAYRQLDVTDDGVISLWTTNGVARKAELWSTNAPSKK